MASSANCNPAWSTLPENILVRVAGILLDASDIGTLQSVRYVNKHWSNSACRAFTRLKPKDLEREEFSAFLKKLKSKFSSVQSLDMPAVWLDDTCCSKLASEGTRLRALELFWGDCISDKGLQQLAKLPLRSLKIYHCRLLTDIGMAALTRTPLEELWLYGANQVTDDGFQKLESLKTLKALRLMYCNRLTRWGLEPLFGSEGLQIFVRFCRRISCEINIS